MADRPFVPITFSDEAEHRRKLAEAIVAILNRLDETEANTSSPVGSSGISVTVDATTGAIIVSPIFGSSAGTICQGNDPRLGLYVRPNSGSTDDLSIQSAIDAASAAKIPVFFASGTYRITQSIMYKPDVDLIGDTGGNTIILWDSVSAGVMLNICNISLQMRTIKNLHFKAGGPTSGVIGILGGSTLANYNSAIGTFENLIFDNVQYGICGNGEPAGVGIFDCYFKNIWCIQCFFGIWLFGSGNRHDHHRIVLCDIGLAFDYLNAESFDSATVTGGIFIQNNYDVAVRSAGGTRPITFVGTWFEQSANSIMLIPYADTRVMTMTFSGCMMSTAGTVDLFNVINAIGSVCLDKCTFHSGGAGTSMALVSPLSASGRLLVRSCIAYDVSGAQSFVVDV